VALVFVVIFIFLQNFRATLIPTIAVPIVLMGTFGVLAAFGYSINTLTMLAMVLAVGLLVDDAIVVVENVERVMSERRLSPREAARQSMDEISGALVGAGRAHPDTGALRFAVETRCTQRGGSQKGAIRLVQSWLRPDEPALRCRRRAHGRTLALVAARFRCHHDGGRALVRSHANRILAG
jgi:hypothetical protein